MSVRAVQPAQGESGALSRFRERAGLLNWCCMLPLACVFNVPLPTHSPSRNPLFTRTPQNIRNFLVVDEDGNILQVS